MNDSIQASERSWLATARDIGVLRLMLGVLALIVIAFRPSPEMETIRTGWGLVRTGVIPALGPVVFMVLLFDLIMSRVFMSDAQGEAKQRYRHVLLFDGLLCAAVLLSWLPFIISLLSAR